MKKMICLTLALALFLALGTPALATTITAIGTGQVQVMPDMATFNIGVSATKNDIAEAISMVNERIAAVRSALLEAGVNEDQIAISDIYMYTSYDYEQENYEDKPAYSVSHQLYVKVSDTARLGELIDVALSAGANQLNGVSFSLSDSSKAYSQALTMATREAQNHAKTLAEASGLTLGVLENLTESPDEYAAYGAQSMAADGGMGAETQIDVGTLTVTVSVQAAYSAE